MQADEFKSLFRREVEHARATQENWLRSVLTSFANGTVVIVSSRLSASQRQRADLLAGGHGLLGYEKWLTSCLHRSS